MRLTEVRCYVLELVEAGELSIDRNGALEPSIHGYDRASHRFTEKRMLTAVQDLQREGYIKFSDRGLHGVYKGLAQLTDIGQLNLPTARARLAEFAELRERQAAEREAFEQKRAEELAAFEAANQVVKVEESDEDLFAVQKIAAAERVRAQLDLYRSKLGADLGVASIMVRVSDDTIVSIDTADLLMLCDAVAPHVEPHTDGRGDAKLYLSRYHAGLLADLMWTYFPAEFGEPNTTTYVRSLRRSLTTFAGVKR